MNLFGHHHHHCDNPLEGASPLEVECYFMLAHIIERLNTMSTKEQVDKLGADIAALITEATNDIQVAIAAAQSQSADPAIDALDATVTAATQKLKDIAASLVPPTAAPAAAPPA